MLLMAAMLFTACSAKPPQKVAAGEDAYLYKKSELTAATIDVSEARGKLATLLTAVDAKETAKIRFEVSKSYLTGFRPASAKGEADEPVLQYKIEDHWDLRPEKNKEGKASQFLVKDDTANKDWQKREYIEVDPYDPKAIAPMRDTLVNLYDMETLKKTYVIGQDDVPGLAGRELEAAMKQFSLTKGSPLELKFTKTELLIFTRASASQPVIVARLPVAYYDLVRDKDEDGEEKAELVRDQKANAWSTRRYVEINPEVANVEDGDQKLFVKADLDGKCFARSAVFAELGAVLARQAPGLTEAEEICIDVSQTILTVSRLLDGKKELLLTFDVSEHVDVNLDARDVSDVLPSGKYQATWDKRRYVRLSLSNPHLRESHVKPSALEKTLFTGQYVYVATVESAHSDNGMLFTGQTLVGSNRIEFSFDEKNLTAYKVGERLNPTTARSPALRYAAEYFDIGQVRNPFGDGTNVVNELTDRPWQERRNVRIAFAKNEVASYFSDFFKMEELFGGKFTVRESKMLGEPEVDKDYLSYETEEVIVRNFEFSRDDDEPVNETGSEPMTVIIRHSFVRVDGRDYQAKEYPAQDFSRFGYFRTTQYGLDEEGQTTDGTLKHFIERHDLSGDKKVVIYLSAGYPERYYAVTEQVIASWNMALKKAVGRDNIIELRKNSGQKIGDPRYNMIAYSPDRNPSAPAGYGPSVADPETGEIISSRTFLYGDSIRYIKASGGDYYDIIKDGKLPSDFAGEGAAALAAAGALGSASLGRAGLTIGLPANMAEWKRVAQSARGPAVDVNKMLARADAGGSATVNAALNAPVMKDLRAAIDFDNTIKRYQRTQQSLAGRSQCMIGANEHIVSAVEYIQANMQKSRAELIEDLEIKSVYNILLHEVGHNLGLRHNFQGSFDEMNFHPKYFKLKPLEEAGQTTPGDYAANYRTSSIMDYNDMFEGLAMAPGPYDLAAIKYGYGDLLEVIKRDSSGAVIRDETGAVVTEDVRRDELQDGMEVRPYKFCTDGHVNEDPTCKRFDRGTTVSEIVTSLAEQYDVGYYLKGFRRGHREFIGSSTGVLTGTLFPMRQIIDELFFKLIRGDFEGQDQSGPVEPGNFADYVAALNTTLAFFTKVLSAVEPGTYHFDKEKAQFVSGEPKAGEQKLVVPLGVGKYLERAYAQGADGEGDDFVVRRGVEFDKLATIFVLMMRGFPALKYERISLAVNYSVIAKEAILDILSRYMRDDFQANLTVLEDPATKTLVAVPSEYQASEGEKLSSVTIPAATNLQVKVNAMIFTMSNYNSTADQTFEDYINFRVKGVDDQALGGVSDKLEFSSSNGLKSYVVPQTNDGLSISYALAKPGPEASKAMLAALSELAQIKADVDVALNEGFEPVLATVIKLFPLTQGQELPAAVIANFRNNKSAANLQTLIGFVDGIDKQATEQGITELIELIKAERATWPAVMATVSSSLEKQEALQSQADAAKDTLRGIESSLIQLRSVYDIFN